MSTLMIFLGICVYVYGKLTNNNQSDNDLIMKQITEVIGNDDILSMNSVDIHGFGNNSIIITANGIRSDQERINRFVILDTVNNQLLQKMNDPFGIKSSYRTTFNYTIFILDMDDRGRMLLPYTEYVLDIVDDLTKEIIVKYYVMGSTYEANGTAIFMYSYEDEMYKIIGTYPDNDKPDYNINCYSGDFLYGSYLREQTCFGKIGQSDRYIACSDGTKTFCLNSSGNFNREYWIQTHSLGPCLVMVHLDFYGDEKIYINIYSPRYEKDELLWDHLYSAYEKKLEPSFSRDDLAKVLSDIMDSRVVFVDEML